MTQSHQLQGLRKMPAQGRLYPQVPLGQMYGSSGFFCIFISYSCVSVSLLIFNTNNTLLILFILLFINCAASGGMGPLGEGSETSEIRSAEQSYYWQQPHSLHSVCSQCR